jgi:hypothetical protein
LAWRWCKLSSLPWDIQRDPLPSVPTVGVLDQQPTKGVTRGWRLCPRQDRNLKETRGTQFGQVHAAMCIIPYDLYVV